MNFNPLQMHIFYKRYISPIFSFNRSHEDLNNYLYVMGDNNGVTLAISESAIKLDTLPPSNIVVYKLELKFMKISTSRIIGLAEKIVTKPNSNDTTLTLTNNHPVIVKK